MSLAIAQENKTATSSNWPQWLMIAALVYLLLVAVATIGSGFKAAAGDQAKELFAFANNPITAVVIGTATSRGGVPTRLRRRDHSRFLQSA